MSVYLELFHGRTDPDVDMDDWGTEGPVLGPLRFVHGTYQSDVKLAPENPPDPQDEIIFLSYVDDMIYYDGVYYGDWSVISAELAEKEFRHRLRQADKGEADTRHLPRRHTAVNLDDALAAVAEGISRGRELASIRASQWLAAADGSLPSGDALDELYEADEVECRKMADFNDKLARGYVRIPTKQ